MSSLAVEIGESDEVRGRIRALIFEGYEPEGEDGDDLLDWEDLDDYIEELCGYELERLSQEPDVLTGECVRIQKQLQEVACSNYRALINSFESAGAVEPPTSPKSIEKSKMHRFSR